MRSLLVFLILLVALPSPAGAQTTRPARPNVIVVLIDDMGIGDLSCYDKSAAPTPAIDRLAREGLRFTHYYSNAPICSPSRCAILTGQYPQRHRITSFLEHRASNNRRGLAQWLDPATPSIARLLQSDGYATAHFGKWHLGGGRDVGEAPLVTDYGFDQSLTQFEGLGDRVLGLFDKHDGSAPEKSGLCTASEKLGRGKIEWVDRSEETAIFVKRSIAFMDAAVRDGKPFFINVWPDDVHSPFFPPKDLATRDGKRAKYRAVVEAMDRQLAALFDHVRDTPALRDNTVILVLSDNGPEPGAGTAGIYRGNKGQLYDGGIREPLIVWAPRWMAPAAMGTTNDTTVIVGMDLAPSIHNLAGLKANTPYDGQNMKDALFGSPRDRNGPIFWRRPPDRPGPKANPLPDLAMREGRWKLLCMADGTSPQLYDLATDPSESKTLADELPDRVKALTAAARAWNATMPADHPDAPRDGE